MDITNWDLYWNLEGSEMVRANLVYSAYVSPDRKYFCQWFHRDERYHPDRNENVGWTDELLENRFRKELKYHGLASQAMPTLPIVDIDERQRKIIFEWPGDDFLMQSIQAGSRENILPDWKDQWRSLIEKMWNTNITKLSLHPNSWTVKDGVLIPFNWFFCYDTDIDTDSFSNLLIQISPGRMEKLEPILERLGIDKEKQYPVKRLQTAAFESFRFNYDDVLIDRMLSLL